MSRSSNIARPTLKHMGSRAVVVICRDEVAARDRFGVRTGEIGIVYTRTGRRFFNDELLTATKVFGVLALESEPVDRRL